MAPKPVRRSAFKSPGDVDSFFRETTNNPTPGYSQNAQEHDRQQPRPFVAYSNNQGQHDSEPLLSFPQRHQMHAAPNATNLRPGFEWLSADSPKTSFKALNPPASPSVGEASPVMPTYTWRGKDDTVRAAGLKRRKSSAVAKGSKVAYAITGVAVTFILLLLYVALQAFPRKSVVRVVPNVVSDSNRSIVNRTSHSISFRDQLEEGTKYLTTPLSGTFADQTMVMYHLTYLASILDRIPVVPSLALIPENKNTDVTPRASSVYDVRLFARTANVSLVDWDEIRSPLEGTVEPLGCWIGTTAPEAIEERSRLMWEVGLSASFYPMRVAIPSDVKGLNDLQAAYAILAGFDSDALAQRGLMDQAAHTDSIKTLTGDTHTEPDQQMMCIDYTLFHTTPLSSEDGPRELDQYEHTAFLAHGQHLRFSPSVIEIGKAVTTYLLGAATTQYIAVHIPMDPTCRSSDLKGCLPALPPIMNSVERVRTLSKAFGKRSREQRHQARVLSVIVSTDIEDVAFLGELAALGWVLLDHEEIELRQRYGTFSAEVIESVVHSRALGFVGRRGDSASTLAALRVRTWKKGLSVLL